MPAVSVRNSVVTLHSNDLREGMVIRKQKTPGTTRDPSGKTARAYAAHLHDIGMSKEEVRTQMKGHGYKSSNVCQVLKHWPPCLSGRALLAATRAPTETCNVDHSINAQKSISNYFDAQHGQAAPHDAQNEGMSFADGDVVTADPYLVSRGDENQNIRPNEDTYQHAIQVLKTNACCR